MDYPGRPLLLVAALVVACGSESDDGNEPGDETPAAEDEGTGGEDSSPEASDESGGGDESSTGATDDDGSDESTGGEPGDTTDEPIDPTFDCDDVVDGPFAIETFVQGVAAGGPMAFDGIGGLIVATPGGHADVVTYNRFEADGSFHDMFEAPYPWVSFLAEADGVWVPTFAEGLREYSENAKPLGTLADLEPAGALARDRVGRVWLVDHTRVGQIDSSNFIPTAGTAANAIAVDPIGKFVYWTDASDLYRVAIDGTGPLGDIQPLGAVGIPSAAGLTSDACGNLYATQSSPGQLVRLRVDALGEVTRTPLLEQAHTDAPLGPPVFGRGAGFSETSVYMVKLGSSGADILAVELNVPGADS